MNVWYWGTDAVAIARELQAAGIERILWSNEADGATIEAMNRMASDQPLRHRAGCDGSRDVQQAAVDAPRLAHGSVAEGPDVQSDGDWTKGWEVELKGGDAAMRGGMR